MRAAIGTAIGTAIRAVIGTAEIPQSTNRAGEDTHA